MEKHEAPEDSLSISPHALLAFVRTLTGRGIELDDDEHLSHPGRWDPVVRIALERIAVFGPRPEPWRFALSSVLASHPEIVGTIAGGHRRGEEVELNPQPLPPRVAFMVAVARAVIDRAELFQELADAASRDRDNTVVSSGYLRQFCDDWCGSAVRLIWPYHWPRPNWFVLELNGMDLLVLATEFRHGARQTVSAGLRQGLVNGGARLIAAGLAKFETSRAG